MYSKIFSTISCVILILLIGIAAGAESGAPLFDQVNDTEEQVKTTETGMLMEDGLFESLKDGEYRVLGSDTVVRSDVKQICFLNSLEAMSSDAWDVSASGDGSVLAEINNGTLKIAAESGVKAPTSCAYLFGLYRNLNSVTGTENFDTSDVTDMTGMFSGCSSLETIDLNSWDVSNVTSMASMFEGCTELTNVSAENWDMSSLKDSSGIFNECTQLGIDSIDGLNTKKYDEMEAEAALTYTPLKLGFYTDAVKELQDQLNAKGYYCGKADGIYGTQTAVAVHAFKADHNIYDGGAHDPTECTASALMQAALFTEEDETAESENTDTPTGSAKETSITLIIPAECEIKEETISDDQVRINLLLKNTSETSSVVAYTLAVYATSVWTADSDVSPTYYTCTQTIAPGATERSGNIIINSDSKIANLCIGVQSVTYENGSAVTAENIDYSSFSAIAWAWDHD